MNPDVIQLVKIKGSFEEAYQTTSWWDWLYDPVAVASENIENNNPQVKEVLKH